MQGTMQHIARKHGEDRTALEGPDSPIYAAQVELLFRQMPWAVLSNFLVSTLLSIALWPLVDHVKILSWVGAVFLVSGARWAVGWRYRQRSEPNKVSRYRRAYVVVTFLSGVVWGSAAPLFMLDAEAARQLVVALSLMGMVAGAVSSMVAVRWTYLLYTLSTMVPMGLAVFSYHDQVHTTMGVMVVVYVVVMLGMARRLERNSRGFPAPSLQQRRTVHEPGKHLDAIARRVADARAGGEGGARIGTAARTIGEFRYADRPAQPQSVQ